MPRDKRNFVTFTLSADSMVGQLYPHSGTPKTPQTLTVGPTGCTVAVEENINCIKHFHWLNGIFRFDITIVFIGNNCNVKTD